MKQMIKNVYKKNMMFNYMNELKKLILLYKILIFCYQIN